jgi:GNAT superfamily N-acetyltransferase
MKVTELTDPEQKLRAVAAIITTLPEWFGIPESNERYIKEIADKDAFAAYTEINELIGLVALRYHFDMTAEIWWLGVNPEYHRQGIGTLLFEAIKVRAIERGCRALAVMTLSPRSAYPPYERTRAFYERLGFRLFIEVNENDLDNPLAWMSMPLEVR